MKRCLRTLLSLLLVLSFLPFNLPVHMTGASEDTTNAEPYIVDAVYADGKVTVTFGAKGDMSIFDLALIYNGNEVEVESYKYDVDFKSAYSGVTTSNNEESRECVIFGGASGTDSWTWSDAVGQVVLKVKQGIKSTEVSVCKDSRTYKADQALREIAVKADTKQIDTDGTSSEVKAASGDVNGDGAISMEDAYHITSIALGYEGKPSKEQISVADINQDGAIDLRDAQLLLKQVTGLAPTMDGYSVATSAKVPVPTTKLTKNSDGTYTLDVSVTNADISMLDYGFLTGDNWNVKNITWGAWSTDSVTVSGSVKNRDGQKEYHFAASTVDTENKGYTNYSGNLCTLILEKVNAQAEDTIEVFCNSMKNTDAIHGSGTDDKDDPDEKPEEYRPYIANAEYADGKITVDVGAIGELSAFDIGLIYNGNEVEVEEYKYTSDFADFYYGMLTNMNQESPKDYIVFGGTASETCPWSNTIAQVVFKVKEGVSSTEISVCKDSASYPGEQPLRDTAVKADTKTVRTDGTASEVKLGSGDVNGDGAISIEDASLVLKCALRIINLTEQGKLAADIDQDGVINLTDFAFLLKQVIGINPTMEGYGYASSDKIPVPTTKLTKNSDGTYTLDVSVTNADISMFDYGLLLGSNWNVKKITYGEWKNHNAYSDEDYVTNQDGQTEYHFAGGCIQDEAYSGTVCTLILNKRNTGVADTIKMFSNSMSPTDIRYIEAEGSDTPIPDDKPVTDGFTPSIANASYSADGTITIDIAGVGNTVTFDIGLMYDSSKVECISTSFDENFLNAYKRDGFFSGNNQGSPGDYIVYGGVYGGFTETMNWNGVIAHATFRFKDGVDSAEFAVCKDSRNYYNDSISTNEPIRNLAVKEDSVIVYKNGESKKTELITNPDGTTTEKTTANRVESDGTKKETVKETTETTTGAVKVTETETSTKTDGSTETVKKETITNPDGSLEQQIETIRKENERLLKMVEKLLKLTEELYNYSVKKEQQLADGSTLVKEVSESAVEVNGRIEKSSVVKDERKDSTGKSMEAFEYDASVLDKNTEWKTDKKESVEDTYKDKVEAKKPRNSVMYDITPTVSGEAVQVSGGSVRVSLYYGEPKKEGSRFKVYDCEKDAWLDAHYEDGYIVFDATHFSKYVITEVDGVRQGDLDGDGNVTLGDAQLCLKAALKISALDETQIPVADMDGDNQITLSDAQLCLKTALRII